MSESRGTAGPESGRLQDDIERSRAAVAEDVNALSHKLSRDRVKRNARTAMLGAKDQARRRMHDFAGNVKSRAGTVGKGASSQARRNALPIALVALGAGALAAKKIHDKRSAHGRHESRFGHYGAGERVEIPIQHEEEEWTHEEGEHVTKGMHRAKGENIKAKLSSKPVAFGITAFAVGLGIGLLAPVSGRERKVMSGAGGKIRERMRGASRGIEGQQLGAGEQQGSVESSIGRSVNVQ